MTVAVYMQVDRFFPTEVVQRGVIYKWLAQNGIDHASVQWFIDRESKSEFQQLSEDIENGSFETVVLYSLEQAFTSIALITGAFGKFASMNMAFASASQNISFDQESIKSAHSLLSVVHELAETHRRMRQKQGIEKAKEKGLYKGKKPGSIKRGFDPKKILRWHARGWNSARISKKLGICESTVFRYLRMAKGK